MSDKTREEFEAFIKSADMFKYCFLVRRKNGDYEYCTIQAAWEGWQSAKECYAQKFIDISKEKPEFGIPIIINVNGITRCEMYILDRDNKHVHWLEPYFHGEGDVRIYIDQDDLIKWMPLPEEDQ